VYGSRLIDMIMEPPKRKISQNFNLLADMDRLQLEDDLPCRSDHIRRLMLSDNKRYKSQEPVLDRFQVVPPRVVTTPRPGQEESFYSEAPDNLHTLLTRRKLVFPSRMAIEHDCGKLRMLAELLGILKHNGHRCLLFT
jgi:hypothetical protein